MKTLQTAAIVALFSGVLAHAGQTITVNYVLGSQVFTPTNGTYTNNDSLSGGTGSTGGFQVTTSGAAFTQTIMQLLLSTSTGPAMAATNKVDTVSLTLSNPSGLTVTGTNPQNLTWTVTDTTTGTGPAFTHTFSYTAGSAVTYSFSDGTRLLVTPLAPSNTVLSNSATNSPVSLQASFTYQAPEPATYVMFGAGLVALAAIRRKRA